MGEPKGIRDRNTGGSGGSTKRFPRLKGLNVTLQFFEARDELQAQRGRYEIGAVVSLPGCGVFMCNVDSMRALAQGCAGRRFASGELRCQGTRKQASVNRWRSCSALPAEFALGSICVTLPAVRSFLIGAHIRNRHREVHPGIKEACHHLHVVQPPLKAEKQCLEAISEDVSVLSLFRPGPRQIPNEGRTSFALQNYVHIAFRNKTPSPVG